MYKAKLGNSTDKNSKKIIFFDPYLSREGNENNFSSEINNEEFFDKDLEIKIDRIIGNNQILLKLKDYFKSSFEMLYDFDIDRYLSYKQPLKNKIKFIENEITILNHDKLRELPENRYRIVDLLNKMANSKNKNTDFLNNDFGTNYYDIAFYIKNKKVTSFNDLFSITDDKFINLWDKQWECFLLILYDKLIYFVETDLEKEKKKLVDKHYPPEEMNETEKLREDLFNKIKFKLIPKYISKEQLDELETLFYNSQTKNEIIWHGKEAELIEFFVKAIKHDYFTLPKGFDVLDFIIKNFKPDQSKERIKNNNYSRKQLQTVKNIEFYNDVFLDFFN